MASTFVDVQEATASASRATLGPPTDHRRDIDGLRALAVLSVLGFHCGIPWLRGGFVGVDIFFVISGYLISSIIYRDLRLGTFSIARFYERRAKRILPALSVVLLFCLALSVLVLSPVEASHLGDSAFATSLSASNFLFWHQSGYFDAGSDMKPLLMTWSLAVEEQFYMAFPLIMILIGKKSNRSLLVILGLFCAFSLLVSFVAEFTSPSMNFYSPLTRAWELGAGALLAIWQSRRAEHASVALWNREAAGAIGLLLVALPIILYRPESRFPGYEALPPVLGSVLIIASQGGRVNRILGVPPLVGIGLISYSLYLWHWPLLSFARIISAHPLHPQTIFILMTLAFAAATVSYYSIEKPFRSQTRARTTTVLLAYSGLILVLAGLGGILSLSHGLSNRIPELARVEFEANIDRDHPCLVNKLSALNSFCKPPANPENPSLALLGDSHAESISNQLRGELTSKGWQLETLTHGSCPPTKGITRWTVEKAAESCREFNRQALSYVLSRPDIQMVALLAGWGGRVYVPDNWLQSPATPSAEQSAENLKVGVKSEIDALEASGKRVILLDDYPEFSFDPVESIRYRVLPFRRALNRLFLSEEPEQWQSTSEDAALELVPAKRAASAEFAEIAKTDPNLLLVSLKDNFCAGGRCYFANQSELFYFDGDHLSDEGAKRIMPIFSKALERP